ncbi:adenosylcobinamide-GDP ribazoletransferase [Paludibacterium denitrificans]|uniref:adenosylcobinamide-GDP ribazoletransferase n=1 Tax=Paludibacterium denitrificans TaxID=2675226 RepID=UPI00406BAFDF
MWRCGWPSSFSPACPRRLLKEFQPSWLSDSARWFAVVGLLVGALVAAATAIGQHIDPWLGALLGLICWVWVTGGLHLDGLGDLGRRAGRRAPQSGALPCRAERPACRQFWRADAGAGAGEQTGAADAAGQVFGQPLPTHPDPRPGAAVCCGFGPPPCLSTGARQWRALCPATPLAQPAHRLRGATHPLRLSGTVAAAGTAGGRGLVGFPQTPSGRHDRRLPRRLSIEVCEIVLLGLGVISLHVLAG